MIPLWVRRVLGLLPARQPARNDDDNDERQHERARAKADAQAEVVRRVRQRIIEARLQQLDEEGAVLRLMKTPQATRKKPEVRDHLS